MLAFGNRRCGRSHSQPEGARRRALNSGAAAVFVAINGGGRSTRAATPKRTFGGADMHDTDTLRQDEPAGRRALAFIAAAAALIAALLATKARAQSGGGDATTDALATTGALATIAFFALLGFFIIRGVLGERSRSVFVGNVLSALFIGAISAALLAVFFGALLGAFETP